MKNQSVCFTGHRVIQADELTALKRTLSRFVKQAIDLQLHYFYCGGARGFDMLAGFAVLEMKKRYPQVRLIMVLPCRDQDAAWNVDERAQYRELLEAADLTVCLSETYYKGCMLRRNQYLVDHCTLCLAYQTHPNSGTAQTVRLAKERGLIVRNLADLLPKLSWSTLMWMIERFACDAYIHPYHRDFQINRDGANSVWEYDKRRCNIRSLSGKSIKSVVYSNYCICGLQTAWRYVMTRKQRTKLELVRIEGICRMLVSKFDEQSLGRLINRATDNSTKDARRAVFRLPRYQLIRIIELAGNAISDEDIDSAYEQYRYGLKPGFTLYRINKRCRSISEASAYRAIVEYLSSIKYDDEENLKNIAAKAHERVYSSVIEFSFSYLSKYSFLTENEEPDFIYEYETCFAWIDIQNAFLAIKNAHEKVLSIIKNAISSAYDTQVTGIKLTKGLIHDVFGDDTIKKGSFIKPNASDNEAEKLVVSDSRFAQKQAVQNSVSGYDMTGTYLTETIGDDQSNTLGINCEKGSLYLTSNVSATVFREWSVQRISTIIKYLSTDADYLDFDIFKAKNLTDSSIWGAFSLPQKKVVEQICYSVYVAHKNRQDSAPVSSSTSSIKSSLEKHFHYTFQANCLRCQQPYFPRCSCGSPSFGVTRKEELLCTSCGQIVDLVLCEEGHPSRGVISEDVLVLYPTTTLLNMIAESIKECFGFTISGSFYIHCGRLTLLREQRGSILNAAELPELMSIATSSLDLDEYGVMLNNVQELKEKCRNSSNNKCNTCEVNSKHECLMKLFTLFPPYRPSPHQAAEFGDVSFSVTLNGASCVLVGIAKSAIRGKDTFTLGESSGSEMIRQVLTATHDARIGVIAAICPMRFHDQLIEELRYISKLTGKPVVILDDKFMTRLIKTYKTRQNL